MTERAFVFFDPLILKRMGFGVKAQAELLNSAVQRPRPVLHSNCQSQAHFLLRVKLNGECLEGRDVKRPRLSSQLTLCQSPPLALSCLTKQDQDRGFPGRQVKDTDRARPESAGTSCFALFSSYPSFPQNADPIKLS